ncbi:MAG: ROK family protein [Candidatus Omnitrophota bacterium]
MKKRFYAGVDVGATFTKIALVDDWARLVVRSQFPSKGFSNKSYFAETLKKNLCNLLSAHALDFSHMKALGIGLPGPIDFDRGIVLSLTNIRGWNKFALRSYLKKYFSCPIFLENDANCMALAESRLGAAKTASCALCLTLGTGVGGGLILNKKIYRGPFYFGGEIGHIPLKDQGPVCACGGRGCLEQYIGNRALLSKARKIFGRSITLEAASLLAKGGNKKAVGLWRKAGEDLGFALGGIINVFNPQVIVIGGGVAAAGRVLLAAIQKKARRHAMQLLKTKVKIRKAVLGNDAGVLGAALLAKEGTGC